MKTSFATLILVGATTAFLLGGCQQNKTDKSSTTFDSIVINKKEPLIHDEQQSPKCNLQINLKYAIPADSITQRINDVVVRAAFEYEQLAPQAAVDSFVNHYLSNYHNDLTPYYKEEKKKGDIGGWYNYEYTLNSRHIAAKDSIIGYEIDLYTYEGGAHGSHTITYLNFNAQTGEQILLEDVFTEGYETLLSDRLLKALLKHTKLNSLEELQNEGFLTATNMYPSKNFLLTSEGIKFYYNAYEIAPYAMGPTELTLSYEEIKDLLKH